jgi:hypothetical protein
MDDKLQQDLDEGKFVLGGCCLSDIDPKWQCVECKTELYKKEREFNGREILEFQRRPRKCPCCLSTNISTELTEQREMTPGLADELEDFMASRGNAFDEFNYRSLHTFHNYNFLTSQNKSDLAEDAVKRLGWECMDCKCPTYKVTEFEIPV